jgi:hypothetical protein
VIQIWHTELDVDGDGRLSDNELLTLASMANGNPPTMGYINELKECLQPVSETKEVHTTANATIHR